MSFFNTIKSIFSKRDNEQHPDHQGIDFDKLEMNERIDFENQMRKVNPNGECIHYINKTRILLSELIAKAGFMIDYPSIRVAYAIIEDIGQKSWHKIENIAEYSPQDDMLEIDENGCWYAKSRGLIVTVHLIYQEGDNSGYLTIHNRWHGMMGENAVFYNHATFLHNPPGVYNAELKQLKYSMDIHNQQELFEKLETERLEATNKFQSNLQLTPYEFELLGLPLHPQVSLQLAKDKMKEHRWGDALTELSPAYSILKHYIMTDNATDQLYDLFFEVFQNIATCYHNKGLYLKANYYLRIPRNKADDKIIESLCKQNAIATNQPTYGPTNPEWTGDIFQLSFVLQSYFNIIPSELSDMFWINNKTMEEGCIDKQRNLWEFDIRKAMQDTDSLSLYISYRSSRTELDDDFIDMEDIRQRIKKNPNLNEKWLRNVTIACVDRSIKEVNSVIVVHLTKQDGVITMNAMLPGFNFQPSYVPKTLTVQFAGHEYVSQEECKAIHSHALEELKNNQQLSEEEFIAMGTDSNAFREYMNGCAAFNNHIWGDAIYYLMRAYKQICGRWFSGKSTDNEKVMMQGLCYRIGFTFSELQQYEYATYFLELIFDVDYIPYKCEYINCITNSRDIYAFNIVNNELQRLSEDTTYLNDNKDSRHNYEFFLRRRLGHTLIDMHKYVEARKCFEILMNDPDSRPTAINELQYIDMAERNGR